MSLGATTSAPASTWLTAVRASSSTVSSFATSPSRITPQWPCAVYSQRQTSVIRTSSGCSARRARSARWTIPSSSQAPDPSSSFSSGTPKRISALPPRAASSPASATRSSTEKRLIPGSSWLRTVVGPTKYGITKSSRSSLVSRTSPRRESVRRRRRSRVAGKALTLQGYVSRPRQAVTYESVSQPARWKVSAESAMVPPMASARNRRAVRPLAPRTPPRSRGELARVRARRRRPERHAARFLVIALLSAVLLLTLLLTAFGTWTSTPVATQPMSSANVLKGGQPLPQIVAMVGNVQIQLPVSQSAVTALGYHHAGDGSLALDPVGRQGNAGLFARLWHRLAGTDERLGWYQLRGARGPGTSALAVGAAPGTDVYSPVTGTVVGITDFLLANRTYGARIDIRPQSAPSVVVSLTHLRPDPSLTVGSAVAKAASKIGVVVDLTAVERQALARYTQDAGNHVSLSVRPAAALSVR